jgi:hypothetical protein
MRRNHEKNVEDESVVPRNETKLNERVEKVRHSELSGYNSSTTTTKQSLITEQRMHPTGKTRNKNRKTTTRVTKKKNPFTFTEGKMCISFTSFIIKRSCNS